MILDNIQPKSVMSIFESICAIPHGSGNTKMISDWCVDFAKARGLEHYQDQLNNVIIIKEATPGYENSEPVILQGHIDMVCQKEPGLAKDMSKEGLDLVVDGDSIYALSVGDVPCDVNIIGTMAAIAMERAIVRAVRMAKTAYGIMGCEQFQE